MASKISDVDLYELLGVQFTADETEIKKAYRKKALVCHPDKNPDNPKAAELFHELSKALEVLVDPAARAAYDRVLNAKKAAKIRHRELDSKRQKLIEDLERREREAEQRSKKYKTFDERTDEEKLNEEIQRLQKEGSKLLVEEQQRMAQQILNENLRLAGAEPLWDSSKNRIKVKWHVSKGDETNGGYDEESLKLFFKKYGDVKELIVSKSKRGTALVEFSTREASEMAIDFEKGLPENPLTLKWLNGAPIVSNRRNVQQTSETLITEKDYESLVLTKMRQAAERQKLIEAMMKEDE